MLHLIQRFSLLFSLRTGSSYLQTAFMNHPNMFCSNESRWMQTRQKSNEKVHHVPAISKITHSGVKVPLTPAIIIAAFPTFRWPLSWAHLAKNPLSIRQAESPFKQHFWRNNIFKKPILICTRDPLRSYISWQLVQKNQNKWSHRPYDQPVRINIKAAARFVAHTNKMLQPFLETQGQILILKYEDGVKVNYRKALKFLGVPYQPPQTDYIQQTTKPLYDLVINYNELKKSTAGKFSAANLLD